MKHMLITTITAALLVVTASADSIHDAARNGDLTGVQAELNKGANVNAKREGGATPLHDATEGGHEEIVELLIVAGANLHARTNTMMGGGGWTPLHSAVSHGYRGIVELLIVYGTDVDTRDSAGKSGLHDAALQGHKEIVELLISKGADLDAESAYYGTPLHVAAGIGHEKIVESLIVNGANVSVKDGFGRTPLDAAELVYEWDSPETKTVKKKIADLIRKYQLIPRLTYSRELLGFSFTAKGETVYMVEVTQDFKQWDELGTINGTGKQVKFTDPRQSLLPFKRNFYRVKVTD